MGIYNKIKAGTGAGLVIYGICSTFNPIQTMGLIEEYVPLPEGDIFGVPYKSIIGATSGLMAIAGGLTLLADL